MGWDGEWDEIEGLDLDYPAKRTLRQSNRVNSRFRTIQSWAIPSILHGHLMQKSLFRKDTSLFLERLPCIGGNRKSLSQTSRKLLSTDALDSTRAI
jgi:hypothetical protein